MNSITVNPNEGRKAACKTYIEQVKLLVTLASAFVVAPAALIPLFSVSGHVLASPTLIRTFLHAEFALICSVLAGYFTLATIAGSQHKGDFNVHRLATRIVSFVQIVAYLLGLWQFVRFVQLILNQTPT